MNKTPIKTLIGGPEALTRGASLLMQPGLRIFILAPLLINFILFLIVTTILIQQFSESLSWLMDWLPGWLEFLAGILWSLFAFVILLVYGYCFSLITNIIAAPFNGLLAEKIQQRLTGAAPEYEALGQMILRTLGRELLKLGYFISRSLLIGLGLLLAIWVPGLNLVMIAIGVIWGAWCMAIQYVDYPADNNRISFKALRSQLRQQPYNSLGFGGLVMLGNMVPFLNIFVMPVAVAGATVLWVEQHRNPEALNSQRIERDA